MTARPRSRPAMHGKASRALPGMGGRMAHPPRALACLVLAVVLLSGCAAKAGGAKPAPTQATATTGILRGLVVDTAVRPVAGANVTVHASGGMLNATTGADGLFRFAGLAPGEYLVEVAKPYFSAARSTVDVHAGLSDPPVAKFIIEFQSATVPYADVYKYEGFYECGAYQVRVCSNVNIATWVVVCADTGVCAGNVTNDRTLLFQWIPAGVSFLQAELSWQATLDSGKVLTMLMGGGNEAELKQGVNLPAYNSTTGPSPLMGRVTNHEGPGTWCARVPSPPCQTPDTLNSSKIGTERALLVQVDAGPTVDAGADCVAFSPCGAGFAAQQPFSLFTSAFYNYEPPADWLFAETGAVPPPPPA